MGRFSKKVFAFAIILVILMSNVSFAKAPNFGAEGQTKVLTQTMKLENEVQDIEETSEKEEIFEESQQSIDEVKVQIEEEVLQGQKDKPAVNNEGQDSSAELKLETNEDISTVNKEAEDKISEDTTSEEENAAVLLETQEEPDESLAVDANNIVLEESSDEESVEALPEKVENTDQESVEEEKQDEESDNTIVEEEQQAQETGVEEEIQDTDYDSIVEENKEDEGTQVTEGEEAQQEKETVNAELEVDAEESEEIAEQAQADEKFEEDYGISRAEFEALIKLLEEAGENSNKEELLDIIADYNEEELMQIKSVIEEGELSLDERVEEGELEEGANESLVDDTFHPISLDDEFSNVSRSALYAPMINSLYMVRTPAPIPGEPGDLSIDKKAKIVGSENLFNIELTLNGKDKNERSDVVLVIDTSGSMKGKKIKEAKKAAKTFIDAVIPNSNEGNVRIGIVTFDNDLKPSYGITKNSEELKEKISKLKANGGTFTQAGIKSAKEMLLEVNNPAPNKFIVVLTDGEPTYSYDVKEGYKDYVTKEVKGNSTYYYTTADMPKHLINYEKKVGDGIHIKHLKEKEQNGPLKKYWYVNLGNQAISEAKFAQEEDVTVYSIGILFKDKYEYIIEGIGRDGYYNVDTSQLEDVYLEIAGKVSYAAEEAKIIDPMGDMFSIPGITADNVSDKVKIVDKNGRDVGGVTISYDESTETITAEIPKITEALSPIKMKYQVTLDGQGAESGKLYPTNKETTISYTNVFNMPQTKVFPIPQVSLKAAITVHSVLIDNKGNLLKPADGSGAIDFAAAEIKQFTTPYNLNDTLKITADKTVELNGKTYKYVCKSPVNGSNGETYKPDSSPAEVNTGTTPNRHIYFTYVEVKCTKYTVKHHIEQEDGSFKIETEEKNGKVGTKTKAKSKDLSDDETKYTVRPIEQKTIEADGSTVVDIYYDLNRVTFTANSGEFTYDGNPHTVEGFKDNLADVDFINPPFEVTRTETNIGSYDVKFSKKPNYVEGSDGKCYFAKYIKGTLKITKNTENLIVVTAKNAEKVYDGSALTQDEFTHTGNLANGHKLEVVIEGSQKNAGESENVVKSVKVKDANGKDVTKNYSFGEHVNGTLKVTKAKVTMTSASAQKVYDGTALTAKQVADEGFVGSDGATYDVTGSQTIVGSSDNNFSYKLNKGVLASNYEVTKVYGTLEVTKNKLTIKVKGNTATKTYNGGEQSVEGFSVEGAPAGVTVSLKAGKKAEAKGTNVGKYPMGLTKDYFEVKGADNYDVTLKVIDGKLCIGKGALAITVKGNKATKTYNGGEQSAEGFSVEGAPAGVTVSLKAGKKAEAKGTNVGTYDMGLTKDQFKVENADNYDVTLTVIDGQLEIVKKAVEITVTGNKATKTYNMSEQSVEGFSVEGAPAGVTVSLKAGKKAEVKGTNVGTYDMGLTKGHFNVENADNYDVTLIVIDGQLEIVKKAVEITVTGNKATKTYNMSEQSVEGFSVEGAPTGVTVSLKAGKKAEAKGTNVGEYPMGLTKDYFEVKGADNYDVTVKVIDGKLCIGKGALTITVTGNKATKTYNMSEQSVEGFSVEGAPAGVTVSLKAGKKAEAKGTNVGTYDMGLTKGHFKVENVDNYDVTLKVVDGELQIVAKELTIKIKGKETSKTYNGREQIVTGFEVSGVPAGVTVSLKTGEKAEAKGTNVGTYIMDLKKEQFNISGTDNYKVTVVVEDGKLDITKKKATIKVKGNTDTKTYNGGEQSVEGFSVEGAPAGVTVVLNKGEEAKAKGTDVGIHNMGLEAKSFKVKGADNYDIVLEVEDGSLKINPAHVTVTANNASKRQGQSDPTLTAKVTGLIGTDTIVYTVTREAGESVGTYVITPSGKEIQGNYKVTYETGVFTIKKNPGDIGGPEDPQDPDNGGGDDPTNDPEDIPEQSVPEVVPEIPEVVIPKEPLPKTGGLPMGLYLAFGLGVAGIGILKRRR